MKALPASLALLILAGCDDIPRARTEAEIRELARSAALDERAQLQAKIDALELRVIELETDAGRQDRFAVDTYNALVSLRNTFNGNVDQENRHRAKLMTARGGCGTELVTYPDGGQAWRNKECTVKDLK